MTIEILRTESLPKVRDGMLAELIDQKLRQIYDDCAERPRLKKARKVTIEIVFTPSGDEQLDEVQTEFKVKSNLPAESFGRSMKPVRRSKGFGFFEDTDNIDHDARQQSFDD